MIVFKKRYEREKQELQNQIESLQADVRLLELLFKEEIKHLKNSAKFSSLQSPKFKKGDCPTRHSEIVDTEIRQESNGDFNYYHKVRLNKLSKNSGEEYWVKDSEI